jgi:hypothetical protein
LLEQASVFWVVFFFFFEEVALARASALWRGGRRGL